jgi:hypothetical protein
MSVRYAVGVSLLLGVVAFGAVSSASAAQGGACEGLLANGTGGPGGELAGAIGEQESTLESELDDRRFQARLDNASSDEERAQVVAAELDRVEERITAIGECASALQSARQARNLTDEEFREGMDALTAHTAATYQRLNETREVATALPGDVRGEYDINTDRFEEVESQLVALRESLNRTAVGEESTGEGEREYPGPTPESRR